MQNLEQFLVQVQEMPEQEVTDCLAIKFSDILQQKFSRDAQEMLDAIEVADFLPEEKWYYSQQLRYPLRVQKDIVELLAVVGELFQPYLEAFSAERERYAEQSDVENLFSLSPFDTATIERYLLEDFTFVVLHPMYTRYSTYSLPMLDNVSNIFAVSSRIEEAMSSEEGQLTSLIDTMKALSDETRYKVLLELLQPHARNKDIADKLGVTTAAVSFPTQKLIVANLVAVTMNDKEIKCRINPEKIGELIGKLQEDFLK
ncbi:hypothetical protein K6V78_08860 [Streptococcus gallolyticus]|nr:hypothetical protein [Streptococcus gallolyticus]MBY5041615.1 hypothetical protein [Streptococcus gallolyticus]